MNNFNVFKLIFFYGLILFTLETQAGVVKYAGEMYCKLSHPIEWIYPIRHNNTCEEQHIIQRQYNGSDLGNISIIPASSHIATDTWGGSGVWGQGKVAAEKCMDEDPPGTTEDAEEALCQAYQLGRYQLEYAFLLYDYRKDEWDTTLLSWDGVSHLVYVISYWFNAPAKYIRKLSYLIDKSHYHLILDHAVQLPIIIIEGSIGILYNGIGIAVGTILHPVDTVNALIGGAWLIVKSIFLGILDMVLTLFLLVKSIFTVLVSWGLVILLLVILLYKWMSRRGAGEAGQDH